MLGYAPQADILLLERSTGRRLWVELEISRADPVANHAKFATAHLVAPMPPEDAFISMVSSHVDRGRGNLAAHTVGVLRALGMRAFQTLLLPGCRKDEIKRWNHLDAARLRELAPDVRPELRRVLAVADTLGRHANSEIHFAANPVEVLFNIHRWNAYLNVPAERDAWGTRRVRYFAHDLAGNLFAPSKFAAFVRLPAIGQPFQHAGVIPSLTGMSLRAYADIDAALPIFDGRRAWTHLRDHLGFELRSLNDLPPQTVTSFWRWVETCRDAIAVDGKGAMVLKPSPP